MYIPPYYRETDATAIVQFVQANSFAVLISQGPDRPVATHVPLLYRRAADGREYLLGHLARANPQWRTWAEQSVLAVFSGPHSYVSSSWYAQTNVPTWNYQAVHVYGTVRVLEGEELLQALREQVAKYEQAMRRPMSVDALPGAFLEQHLRGIVGFELAITDIQAVAKLSQNRNDEDYRTITQELAASPAPEAQQVAAEMRRRRPNTGTTAPKANG